MNKSSHINAGTRKVIKLGGSLAVTLPSEFVGASGITEGDTIPFASNSSSIKFIPMNEKE